MSSNNNGTSPEMMGFAFIVAAFMMLAYFLFALLAFGALLFTILAFIAWNKPLHLFGETIHPHEARAFVFRGVAGAILVPAFAVFCQALFQQQFSEDLWGYLFIGGYAAGSLGIEILRAQEEAEKEKTAAAMMPVIENQAVPPALPRGARQGHGAADNAEYDVVRTEAQPFRFAEWNDDEEFK